MNFNLFVFVVSFSLILLFSIVWYVFYTNHLRKKGFINANAKTSGNNHVKAKKLLSAIKPDKAMGTVVATYPAVLPNTDDDVADALKYIKPFESAGSLLEDLYEQTGI